MSDLFFPDRTIFVDIQRRKDDLLSDIKAWSKTKDKAEAERQIAAAQHLLDTIESDYQRQVFVAKRLWDMLIKPFKDKDDYALCLFSRFWSLLNMYANRLDALLLEYGIDIMELQKEAGIWILTYKDISLLQYYCGSLQLARKYLAALPETGAQPPVVALAPKAEETPTSKDILTVEDAAQFTGL
jgi:hypothetical protein